MHWELPKEGWDKDPSSMMGMERGIQVDQEAHGSRGDGWAVCQGQWICGLTEVNDTYGKKILLPFKVFHLDYGLNLH